MLHETSNSEVFAAKVLNILIKKLVDISLLHKSQNVDTYNRILYYRYLNEDNSGILLSEEEFIFLKEYLNV